MPRRRRTAQARVVLTLGLLWMTPGLPARAQQDAPAPTFAAEEIEGLVAPIALYPDSLLAQVFMASTYPLEVVEAARFANQHPDLKDDALDKALQEQTWDASVKSLVSFPQVLAMMDEKLDWTQKLGDAFLAQQSDVMDAVQRLRLKAKDEGNLESNAQQTVTVEPAAAPPPQVVVQQAPPSQTVIVIEQADPQVVFVPTYNPTVVYGPWPYPAYPPYYYYPPSYVAGVSMVSFGVGMAVGAAVWGDCDWDGGDVDINVNEYNNFTKNTERNRTDVDGGDRGREGERDREGDRGREGDKRGEGDRGRQADKGAKSKWQHDPSHRKGAQYRDQATQQRFDRGGRGGADSREAFRDRAEQGRRDIEREGAGNMQRDMDRNDARRQQATRDGRDAARDAGRQGDRGDPSRQRDASAREQRDTGSRDRAAANRGGSSRQSSGIDRSRGSDAFKGAGHGSEVRRDSSRGHSSRASAQRGGGGGRARPSGGGGGRRR